MTAEDQLWVQEQITIAINTTETAIEAKLEIQEKKIESIHKQAAGICANLTNHEERLGTLEE